MTTAVGDPGTSMDGTDLGPSIQRTFRYGIDNLIDEIPYERLEEGFRKVIEKRYYWPLYEKLYEFFDLERHLGSERRSDDHS